VADDSKADRREALKRLAVVGGALGCGALAVPTVRFVTAPAHGGASAGRWIKTVRLDSLQEGEPRRVALVADHRDAWTMEKQVQLGGAWLHLGCAVDRRAGDAPGFNCPCHDSSFDAEGRRLDGPSLRDLDTLGTKVEDGFVIVDFQRFRQGTPDKAPVG
jgi:cytochrome b6-f complex iron-sulfur subunit/menaquinol-cytochrome c reductase iron-sulfur subunit